MAGFKDAELNIETENGVLTVRGKKDDDETNRNFLHQGIANRSFERKFNLADHIEVVNAELVDGLLTVYLVKEIPEAMKPRQISIGKPQPRVIAHKEEAA